MGLALLVLLFLVAESFNYGFFIFSLIILTGGILYTLILKVLTKYIFCFKNLYVAGIWAYAGTFFILFYQSIDFTIFYYVIFVYIYVKIFINNVFFDIKDIESDKMKDLNTIPIKLGKDTTIHLLHILNIVSVIILIIAIYSGVLPLYAIFLLITNLYVLFYLEKGKAADYDGLLKYTYLMADAEFILWPIILIIGKIIFNYF
jgi:UbiA prenyltransferase family.